MHIDIFKSTHRVAGGYVVLVVADARAVAGGLDAFYGRFLGPWVDLYLLVLVKRQETFNEACGGDEAYFDEDTLCRYFFSFAAHPVFIYDRGNELFSFDLEQLGIPDTFHLGVRQHFFDGHWIGFKLIGKVEKRDACGIGQKLCRSLEPGVATADDHDIAAGEERTVAGCAVRNAFVLELGRAWHGELASGASRGDEHCFGFIRTAFFCRESSAHPFQRSLGSPVWHTD